MKTRKKSKKRGEKYSEQTGDDRAHVAKSGLHDDEKAMDFGGLPLRDLKKNLGGCG